jgi:predicted transposase YdaD
VIDTAKWEGRIEGKAEGKAEGIAEGKAIGLAEGKAVGLAEGMRQVAARMKDTGVDVATIAKCTGLSEEIILSL